ncbi:MAG: serine hydrolase domain-containing protein [Planctomycetota bacterium]
MKLILLALALGVLVVVLIVLALKRWTSPRTLARVDASLSTAENARAMGARYASKRPGRALAIGIVEGGNSDVVTVGSAPGGSTINGGTVFELGSVTKAFTGLLLAEMVVRGEVHLDWRLADVLRAAALSAAAADITLLQLATHTSGLPRIPPDLSDGEDKEDPYAHYTRERLLGSLESIEVAPSSTSDYSNYGVGLLGEALAIHSGMGYAELLRQRVLDPLGLSSASVGEPSDELIQGFMGKKPTPPWTLPSLAGAGGLRLSMDDLTSFLRAMISPPNGWRPILDLAWMPHFRDDESGSHVGLCWQIEGKGDDQLIWHNGSTFGATSFVGIRPAADVGVAAVQNQSELMGMLLGNPCAAEAIGRSLLRRNESRP